MPLMPDIETVRKYVNEAIDLLERLAEFSRRHRVLTSCAMAAAVAYGAAYYWVNVRPSKVLRQYVAHVNNKRYEQALLCFRRGYDLSREPREKWTAAVDRFAGYFKTSMTTRLERLEPTSPTWDRVLLLNWFSDTLEYEMEYAFTDDFGRDDLVLPARFKNQAETDRLWAYIRSVDQSNGVLAPESTDDAVVRVNRRTKAIFTL